MLCGDYADEHSRVDFSGSVVLFGARLLLRGVRLFGNVREFDFLRLIFCGNFGFRGSFESCGIRLLLRGLRLFGNVRKFDFLRLIFCGNFGFCGSFASCGAHLFLRGVRFFGNVRKFDFLRLIFGGNFGFCGSFASCGIRLLLHRLRLLGNVREFDFLRLIFCGNFGFCGSFESCGAHLFLRGVRFFGNVRKFDFLCRGRCFDRFVVYINSLRNIGWGIERDKARFFRCIKAFGRLTAHYTAAYGGFLRAELLVGIFELARDCLLGKPRNYRDLVAVVAVCKLERADEAVKPRKLRKNALRVGILGSGFALRAILFKAVDDVLCKLAREPSAQMPAVLYPVYCRKAVGKCAANGFFRVLRCI